MSIRKILTGVAAATTFLTGGLLASEAHADPVPGGAVNIIQSSDTCLLTVEVTGGLSGLIEVISYPIDDSSEPQVDSNHESTVDPSLQVRVPRGVAVDSQVEFVPDDGEIFTQWVRSACDVDIYITPGEHYVNGRDWRTYCEEYSQTERCRTDIWATQVVYNDGKFVPVTNWHFNNLTYKAAPRSLYASNPLGGHGKVGGEVSWTAEDGRKWRTECDTATTGRGGCRSYIEATVIELVNGSYRWTTKWVFNNMVRFS